MTETVIHVEGLGKRYRVGERERYFALRDVITRALRAPFERNGARRPVDYLWALRDVFLDVKQGEVVGLIGRNGAGKTTLLKLLSRITRPTAGFAELRGRVGSLLEVGTGFHPELTGRENIYLSGAILGMRKREIERKKDAIVAFAEVERFLDTPLKHYSTGMQMRLAFAVAAHLEPEILLVDEVLAVGDIEFQKKCLGKMQGISKSGRTIVFVSHQMNQIRRLCERVIWIDSGQLRLDGSASSVLGAYEESTITSPTVTSNAGRGTRFVSWEVLEPRGDSPYTATTGTGKVTLKVALEVSDPIVRGLAGAYIYDASSRLLAGWSKEGFRVDEGTHEVLLQFPYLPLKPGVYDLHLCIYDDREQKDYWRAVPSFVIGGVPVTHFMDEWAGFLNIPCDMEFRRKRIR
jgi:lipopolysaccharide transport system ATP-binding protein